MNAIIEQATYSLILDVPERVSKDVVLFLPGVSGGAHSDRFAPLVNLCLSKQISIARMDAWKNADDVGEKSFVELHKSISEAIAVLGEGGYERIIAVGKSFGGGLFLSYHHPAIAKKILWAPAIGIAAEGNFEEMNSKKLKDIPLLLDIKLSETYIKEDPAEINIVHGTADVVIPLENSKVIMEVAHGNLVVIEGADHSFKTETEEQKLLTATATFL